MNETTLPLLAELTTMQVGGRPTDLITAADEEQLVHAVRDLLSSGDPWLLLGGGSNTIVADDGFDGTVVRVATRGIQTLERAGDRVRLRVQAGESWDELVALTVRNRWSGLEALSGIPGSVGAAPVQNIGAYGQELSSVLVAIDFLDGESGEVHRVPAPELELGYRTSALKRGRVGVVLAVELELTDQADAPGAALSAPVGYAQLADALGVELGTRVTLGEVRRTVLGLRAGKGMVLDSGDPDSVSAGSFFTNPIVRESFARSLPRDAPRWAVTPEEPALVARLDADNADHSANVGALASAALERTHRAPEPLVKLSAAWLIEHAGIHRGYALPGSRAAISSKHTLAITNRGGATAAEIVQLAGFVQARVQSDFGVVLRPEPVLVGLTL
jgi:UDP-N-acetylmuramate dehydrogenase